MMVCVVLEIVESGRARDIRFGIVHVACLLAPTRHFTAE